MIEKAQRRLRQARFFYQHLLNERQQTSERDPEAFGFYFSAFIQAARSVTWTIGKEEPDKWKAWEPKWKARRTIEEQKLLEIATELRNAEVKQGGADLTVELEEVAIHELLNANLDLQRRHPAYGYQAFALPGTRRLAYYFEDKEGKKEITDLCMQYLQFLGKLINDFCNDMKV